MPSTFCYYNSMKDIPFKNGLIGRSVVDNSKFAIALTDREMILANSHRLSAWDEMCEILKRRANFDPRGHMHIDFIRQDGIDKRFH